MALGGWGFGLGGGVAILLGGSERGVAERVCSAPSVDVKSEYAGLLRTHLTVNGCSDSVCTGTVYGECSRRTRLCRDQLWLADAGSWQIADRYATQRSAARGVAVGDFRVLLSSIRR